MWARWLAAIVLGLPLAVGVVGLCVLLWPGPLQVHTLPWLLLMFPLWIGAMALAFVFRSGARAWLWLGGATLLCHAAIYALKTAGIVQVAA